MPRAPARLEQRRKPPSDLAIYSNQIVAVVPRLHCTGGNTRSLIVFKHSRIKLIQQLASHALKRTQNHSLQGSKRGRPLHFIFLGSCYSSARFMGNEKFKPVGERQPVSAEFEGGQGDEGEDAGDNPEANDHFGFGNALVLQVVMKGSTVKDASPQPSHPNFILNLAGNGFC